MISAGLPQLRGHPITVEAQPELTAYRGKLLSGSLNRGTPVHAAAFIRAHKVVLEDALFDELPKLRLILIHELFHFQWARGGTPLRRGYADLLHREIAARARGELGESSSVKKALIDPTNLWGRIWRDYVCESFCDTAAWLYSGLQDHPDFTLARRWRDIRRRWFAQDFSQSL